MGLLHTYKTYLYGNERKVHSYALGDIRRSTLRKIWNSKEYRAFRERLRAFEFSPCHICGGCTLVEENKEDCFGNTFPACGACLWAQGVIQCPWNQARRAFTGGSAELTKLPFSIMFTLLCR
jgi:hypothetical protein